MTTTFKVRAETFGDALRFQEIFIRTSPDNKMDMHIHVDRLLGLTVITFKTTMSRKDILKLLHRIQDGHVMWETLQPIELYTGERDFQ